VPYAILSVEMRSNFEENTRNFLQCVIVDNFEKTCW